MSTRFSTAPLFTLLLFPAYLVQAGGLTLEQQIAVAEVAINENCPAPLAVEGTASQESGKNKRSAIESIVIRRFPGETSQDAGKKIELGSPPHHAFGDHIEEKTVSLDPNGTGGPSYLATDVNSGLSARVTLRFARATDSSNLSADCHKSLAIYGALYKLETVLANANRRASENPRAGKPNQEQSLTDETSPYDTPPQTQGAR